MNYQNVIPFEARKPAESQAVRPTVIPMPSMNRMPRLLPVEVKTAPPLTYEEPARDSDVLFEQLEYLIQFADREPDRFNRVKAILLEAFN